MTAKEDKEKQFFSDINTSYLRKNVLIWMWYEFRRRLGLAKKVKHISVHEAKEKIDANELVILDVRDEYNYDRAHIEGSINIEGHRVKNYYKTIPKDKTVAVMCYGGGLSQAVTRYLNRKGYDNAVNLEGGFETWAIEVDNSLLDAIWWETDAEKEERSMKN